MYVYMITLDWHDDSVMISVLILFYVIIADEAIPSISEEDKKSAAT